MLYKETDINSQVKYCDLSFTVLINVKNSFIRFLALLYVKKVVALMFFSKINLMHQLPDNMVVSFIIYSIPLAGKYYGLLHKYFVVQQFKLTHFDNSKSRLTFEIITLRLFKLRKF